MVSARTNWSIPIKKPWGFDFENRPSMPQHIRRFSSRRERLDHAFLTEKLKEAKSYDRIDGYSSTP